MLITDPIGDMIIRIKNAILAGQAELVLPHSKMKAQIAQILVDQHYLSGCAKIDKQPQAELKLQIRYVGKQPAITGVKRVSKPGRRIYMSAGSIPSVLSGYGLTIVSTNKGIITGKDAKKRNIGGEVLCQIW